MVYDGAATVRGTPLNQGVLAGTNLLNNLVKVLIRFRFGTYGDLTVLFELIASLYCFVVFFTLLVLCTHKKE